jgi:hypothetical protein
MINNQSMTKEFAEDLDRILSGVLPKQYGIYELLESKFSFETLGGQLKKDGYGKWLGGNSFQVYPEGVDYYKMGGYCTLFADIEIKKEKTKQEIEHTKRQIHALKREPYLIAWAVITTIATIALSVISLLKS